MLACGIFASLLYVGTDVLGAIRWEGYSYTSQTISELAAIGAPSRSFVTALYLAYDALLVAFGLGVRGSKHTLRSTGNLLIALGVLGLAWPFFPMHLRGAERTLTDTMHIVLSGVTVLFILLAIGFAATAFGKRFRLYSIGTILTVVVFGILTGLDAPRLAAQEPTPWLGIVERISVFAYVLWHLALAVVLLRQPDRQPASLVDPRPASVKPSRGIALGALAVIVTGLVWMPAAYVRDIGAARRRVSAVSTVAATKCGPIEYAERGEGAPVLVVHGAGGGFDQGLLLGEPLAEAGFRVIAMSRFGYLRTPLPKDASAEAQADAHACLLDALGIPRAAVFGVSAGGPSSIQLCLRHPERCRALVLLVPLAYSGQAPEKLSPAAQTLIGWVTKSDFLFWAGSRLFPTRMVESVLGTPIEDVRSAPDSDQRRIYAILDLILPVGLRVKGLLNEGAVAQSLGPLPLDRIAAPTLIASVENDGYRTFAGARYTAEHIPGARFIGYARGGHMLVGHEVEFSSEVMKFLGALSPNVQ